MNKARKTFMLSKLTRQYFTQYFTQRFITSVEPIKTSSLPHNIEVKTPDEISEALADMPTFVPPTFNFASYVNKSETLKKFVELGVDLSKIEKKKGFPQFVLTLDFEKDVKKLLFFLHDLGLPAEDYGSFITKNPLIFKESLKDLETRVYYLQSKKFSAEQIQRVVSKNPFWLSFSTKRIDRRLGWFQKNFNLQGDDIRVLASTAPRLITYNLEHVREAMFSIKEELGFTKQEMKLLLLRNPRVWMRNHEELRERFNYAHFKMHFSHEKILREPEVLSTRVHRLKTRHEFLKFLGKAQYDETKPGYVSCLSLCAGSDADFIRDVAKSSLETFDNFLKTL